MAKWRGRGAILTYPPFRVRFWLALATSLGLITLQGLISLERPPDLLSKSCGVFEIISNLCVKIPNGPEQSANQKNGHTKRIVLARSAAYGGWAALRLLSTPKVQ
jgi:hypothetical protein